MRLRAIGTAGRLAAAAAAAALCVWGCVDGGGNSGGDSSVDEFLGWVKGNGGSNTGGGGVVDSNTAIKDTFTDDRNGKTYNTVKIGGQTWMAENLNYDTANGVGSWCYDNADSNCVRYGRLYNWNTAKTVCPNGWYLPTRDEWDHLAKTVGGTQTSKTTSSTGETWNDWLDAGKKLKAKSGWIFYGSGTDDYGFSALPGGTRCCISTSSFSNAGYIGSWWTATGKSDGSRYSRIMRRTHDDMDEEYYKNGDQVFFSVRCVHE
jgi:uncharacterized protein (TIGR02145 family)